MNKLATRVALRFAAAFPNDKALQQYLRAHPRADKTKHWVGDAAKGKSAPAKQYNAYKPTPETVVRSAKQKAGETSWSKPSYEQEDGEVTRTAKDLGVPPKKLKQAWDKAKVEPLSDKDWSRLENTDSYDTDTFEKADALAEKYDRNIGSVIKGLGGALPAPIVLFRKGKPPYLVGGNTRLMASRAFGAKPSVFALHLD